MDNKNKTTVIKDFEAKTILVSREFHAPPESVWRAFTEKDLLDKWWGPAPWRAETKSLIFEAGGHWLYAMVSPENEKHWGCFNYLSIDYHKSIEIEDAFCDENDNINLNFPVSKGRITFNRTEFGTKVDFKTNYPNKEDVQKIIDMGFEQGIAVCYEQLQAILDDSKNN
jgi:uncharacterized protein YndB with AHSA1/START domain